VKNKGRQDQAAIADLVDDEAPDDDPEAKAGQARPCDGAKFSGGKAEFEAPIR
jgi:hypothetical protein